MKRYIFVECDALSDKGYNKAVEVYLLRPDAFPLLIGSNYQMDSGSWAGHKCAAARIIHDKEGHELEGGSIYRKFASADVELRNVRDQY